jgi:hypothetical protein
VDKNYIKHIAESKAKYHNTRSKMSYEEKFKIVLELQKIDCEMRKNNKFKSHSTRIPKVWQPE